MDAYFDTGIVLKWYVLESNSRDALTLRAQFEPPLPLTRFHRLEIFNAIELKVFRNELTVEAATAAKAHFESDVAAGLWEESAPSSRNVWAIAESLVSHHSAKIGTRSLDILHVASALELGCVTFVSGDTRQVSLAEACGLTSVEFRAPRA